MYPFLPWYKILLNEENDDNPETTDITLSEKDDMSHTSTDDFKKENKDKKIQMIMMNTSSKLRNFKTVMKVLIIWKLQILCVMIVLSR